MESFKLDLFKAVFTQALITGDIQVSFSGIDGTVAEVIEGKCYQALEKIKAVIQNNSLDDPECFAKIEEIVLVLESIGSDGDTRHDFG